MHSGSSCPAIFHWWIAVELWLSSLLLWKFWRNWKIGTWHERWQDSGAASAYPTAGAAVILSRWWSTGLYLGISYSVLIIYGNQRQCSLSPIAQEERKAVRIKRKEALSWAKVLALCPEFYIHLKKKSPRTLIISMYKIRIARNTLHSESLYPTFWSPNAKWQTLSCLLLPCQTI